MATMSNSIIPGVPLDVTVQIFQASGPVDVDVKLLGDGNVKIVSETCQIESGIFYRFPYLNISFVLS